MKKIMFNDRYELTEAVLERRKTMTRRIAPYELHEFDMKEDLLKFSRYKVGEVVAIAQNYKDAGWNADILQEAYVKKHTLFPDLDEYEKLCGIIDLPLKYHKGWNNKMFVMADLMPHHIRIIGIKVERLQGISDEDCMKEGILKKSDFPYKKTCPFYFAGGKHEWDNSFHTPRQAYAALIDKVSGKGAWERNPWVFVYEFELID